MFVSSSGFSLRVAEVEVLGFIRRLWRSIGLCRGQADYGLK
jgi:hypothetical protein